MAVVRSDQKLDLIGRPVSRASVTIFGSLGMDVVSVTRSRARVIRVVRGRVMGPQVSMMSASAALAE
jgi:hypothetical protein